MQITDEIKICGKLMHERGLTSGRSGNISFRVGFDTFLINRAGADLSELTNEALVSCNIKTGEWEGSIRPSIEIGLHQGIYLSCPDAATVIHSHPFYSMLVACSGMSINTDLFSESMAYLDKIVRVPYFHAGSRELADEVAKRANDSQVLVLDNHGVVVWGKSLDECFIKTETLELLCRMQVTAASAGIKLNYLGEEVSADFRRHLKNIGENL